MISKQDLDQKFDEFETKIDTKIDQKFSELETKIDQKFSEFELKIDKKFDQFKDEYIKYIKTTSEEITKNLVQQLFKHSLEFEDEVMIKPGARFLFFTGLRSRVSDLEKRMEILEGIG